MNAQWQKKQPPLLPAMRTNPGDHGNGATLAATASKRTQADPIYCHVNCASAMESLFIYPPMEHVNALCRANTLLPMPSIINLGHAAALMPALSNLPSIIDLGHAATLLLVPLKPSTMNHVDAPVSLTFYDPQNKDDSPATNSSSDNPSRGNTHDDGRHDKTKWPQLLLFAVLLVFWGQFNTMMSFKSLPLSGPALAAKPSISHSTACRQSVFAPREVAQMFRFPDPSHGSKPSSAFSTYKEDPFNTNLLNPKVDLLSNNSALSSLKSTVLYSTFNRTMFVDYFPMNVPKDDNRIICVCISAILAIS